MNDYIYDIEVLPNVFTLYSLMVRDRQFRKFEISPRRNDMIKLHKWINMLALKKARMVGFNNMHYDYPVIHYMIQALAGYGYSAKTLTTQIYNKSRAIFADSIHNPFAHTIWDNQCIVEQIDLFKIHHFDNMARRTSLKRLEFNMRMDNIQEFEIPFDKPIKSSKVLNHLLGYNKHDVVATYKFYMRSKSQIEFREQMTKTQGKSYMNYNDTKIGEEYFVQQLKDELGEDVLFFTDEYGKRKKRTTKRTIMPVKDLIFDYIEFETPKFQAILDKMNGLNMFSIKGKFHWNEHEDYPQMYLDVKKQKALIRKMPKGQSKDEAQARLDPMIEKYNDHHIACEMDGVEFVFGKGGLHASVNNKVFHTTKDEIIIDVDVTSYYPDVGIQNGLYPEHLTKSFCPIYARQKARRQSYAKGTTENAMLKLALNGSYGKTNSEYSALCDPLYTVATTINGQLMLCMLWEQLRKVHGIVMIQVNTDGITFKIPKIAKAQVKRVCKAWEKLTKLQLESAVYKGMWVRDGNNYVAEYMDGKVKQKGAYVYRALFHDKECENAEWHKNHSMMIVQKAVEAEMLHGISATKFIVEHEDIYDFFLCTNVPRTCQLMIGDGYIPAEKSRGEIIVPAELGFLNKPTQRVSRYIVSKKGDGQFTKVMPPLNGETQDRFIGINVGYNVSVYNQVKSEKASDYDINYDFYIAQADKLLKPFRGQI